MGRNIISGDGLFEHVEYSYIFNYEGKWLSDRAFVKATKGVWTSVATNETKYRILRNVKRWDEVEVDFIGDAAVPIFDGEQITTNGVIVRNEKARFSRNLMIILSKGGEPTTYYLSDLLYHGFIDNDMDPTPGLSASGKPASKTMVPGDMNERMRRNTIELSEVSLKSNYSKLGKTAKKVDEKPQTEIIQTIENPQTLAELAAAQQQIKQLKEQLTIANSKGDESFKLEKIEKENKQLQEELVAKTAEVNRYRVLAEANFNSTLGGSEASNEQTNLNIDESDEVEEQTHSNGSAASDVYAPILAEYHKYKGSYEDDVIAGFIGVSKQKIKEAIRWQANTSQ